MSYRLARPLLVGAALAAVSSLAACGPKPLTRDQALAILRQEPRVVAALPPDNNVQRLGRSGAPCPPADDPVLGPLVREGLITLSTVQRVPDTYCQTTATPAGLRALGFVEGSQIRYPAGAVPIYRFRSWEVVPAAVTGLAEGGDGATAHVEFTFTGRPSRAATAFHAVSDEQARLAAATPAPGGVAELRRFDDGWRVESVRIDRAGAAR